MPLATCAPTGTTQSVSAEPRRAGHRVRRGIAGGIAALLIATGMVALAPAAAHAGTGTENAFLAHLNGLRASHGLAPLTPIGDLTAIARQHSAQMARQGTIFHNATLTSQVPNWQTLGENVGMGPSVVSIDNAFDASPGHYANEVNTTYTQVGIGVATVGTQIYVTLDFRRPMNAPAAPAKAPAVQAPATTNKAPATTGKAAHTPSSATATATNATAATNAAAQAAAVKAAAAKAAAAKAAAAKAAAETRALRAAGDPLAQALTFGQSLAALRH